MTDTHWRRESRTEDMTKWQLRGQEGTLVSMVLSRTSSPPLMFDLAVYDINLREKAGMDNEYTTNTHGYMDADQVGEFLTELGLGPMRPHYRAELGR